MTKTSKIEGYGECSRWKWVDLWVARSKGMQWSQIAKIEEAEKGLCCTCSYDGQCGGRWK